MQVGEIIFNFILNNSLGWPILAIDLASSLGQHHNLRQTQTSPTV